VLILPDQGTRKKGKKVWPLLRRTRGKEENWASILASKKEGEGGKEKKRRDVTVASSA